MSYYLGGRGGGGILKSTGFQGFTPDHHMTTTSCANWWWGSRDGVIIKLTRRMGKPTTFAVVSSWWSLLFGDKCWHVGSCAEDSLDCPQASAHHLLGSVHYSPEIMSPEALLIACWDSTYEACIVLI